jgi:hypothetical protein
MFCIECFAYYMELSRTGFFFNEKIHPFVTSGFKVCASGVLSACFPCENRKYVNTCKLWSEIGIENIYFTKPEYMFIYDVAIHVLSNKHLLYYSFQIRVSIKVCNKHLVMCCFVTHTVLYVIYNTVLLLEKPLQKDLGSGSVFSKFLI